MGHKMRIFQKGEKMNDLQELKRLAEAATVTQARLTARAMTGKLWRDDPAFDLLERQTKEFCVAFSAPIAAELIARLERQTAALTDLRQWFEYERNIKSKGCGGGWDMLRCDEQIAVIDAAMIGIIVQEDQAESGKVPDGWKLVPIEPTEDMVIAGFESVPDRGFDGDKYPEEYDAMSGCQQAGFRAKQCYVSMLEAAPKEQT